LRSAAVEFKFSNSTSLLRGVSAAAKVLLALYFCHTLKKFELHSSTAQVVAALKLLLMLYFGHGLTAHHFWQCSRVAISSVKLNAHALHLAEISRQHQNLCCS
jgi:hypothetical protein